MCFCVQSLKLSTAPVFLHVPPRGQPRWKHASAPTQDAASSYGSILVGPDVFDLQHMGLSAEALAKWVSERSDVQARIRRPFPALPFFPSRHSLRPTLLRRPSTSILSFLFFLLPHL